MDRLLDDTLMEEVGGAVHAIVKVMCGGREVKLHMRLDCDSQRHLLSAKAVRSG
jgi:hypothetical protein